MIFYPIGSQSALDLVARQRGRQSQVAAAILIWSAHFAVLCVRRPTWQKRPIGPMSAQLGAKWGAVRAACDADTHASTHARTHARTNSHANY